MLAVVFLLLAASDAAITYRVLTKYGVGVELNSLIRWLAGMLPLGSAIAFGIAIPSLAWLAIVYTLHAPLILALLIAARAGFLAKQLDAHRQ